MQEHVEVRIGFACYRFLGLHLYTFTSNNLIPNWHKCRRVTHHMQKLRRWKGSLFALWACLTVAAYGQADLPACEVALSPRNCHLYYSVVETPLASGH